MKKILFVLASFLLTYSLLYAVTGTISVYPSQLPRDYFGATLTFEYTPDPGTVWTSGKFSLVIPQQFYPAPTTVTAAQGNIRVFKMYGGTTPLELSTVDIQIDGYAVTVNSIAIGSNDTIKIVYGYIENAGEGVQTPMTPGDYYFNPSENPTGSTGNAALSDLKVHISDVAISKTSDKSEIFTGDTLVYNITFSNINPVHPSQNMAVWDTIPAGFEYQGASFVPDSIVGNMLFWDIGNLSISEPVSLSVTVRVKDNAIAYGASVTNTAELTASDMYMNNYHEKASVSTYVRGVSLASSISTIPVSSVVQGQTITVKMFVQNTGNTTTTYATGSVNPTNANVSYLYGPVPSSLQLIPSSGSYLTWFYAASSEGMVAFSGNATASSGYGTVSAVTTVSNQMMIMAPTNTYTPADTPTYTPTYTYTVIPTGTMTAVPTGTYTAVPPTHTSTPAPAASATPDIQITPANTPDVPVYTNRNIFNPDKGDSVTITYKLPYSTKVRVWIYNLNGEVVAELKNTDESGTKSVSWDGKNTKGKKIARGIYFIHIKQGDWQVIRKLIVIK